ncbi:HlyD family secretion protein [Vulgatibacter sp.]|uniref:HlyD family secretion protein n=1 Tax=Vulgatibacter sp. TaxID=1971226 RepID=UPI003562400C
MKRMTKLALGAGVVLLAIGVARTARTGDLAKAGPAEQAAAARVLSRQLPLAGHVGAPGVVEPRDREAALAFHVPGIVAAVHVEEGAWIEAGTPIVALRDESEKAQVAAAEAELASAQAVLRKLRSGARREDVRAARAEADAAKARAKLSGEVHARTERLVAEGAATQEALDSAAAQARADERTAAALEARWEALADGSRPEDVAAARAAVALAEAHLAQARANLERLVLRAPTAGEVLQVLVQVGEYVNPAAGPAVTFGDTSALRVRLDVDERDVARVRSGQPATIVADAWEERFAGRVVEIGRRMGRKNVRTDEPTERLDTKILEVLVELDGRPPLPQGLRVTGYVGASESAAATAER